MIGVTLMNAETGDSNSRVDEDQIDEVQVDKIDDVVPEDTVVLTDTQVTDNVGDVSVELNVEELIAEVEAEKNEDAARKKEIRRRLEDIAEDQNFEDTYAIDLNDD